MVYNKEIDYWLKAAAHDIDVAETLFKHGKTVQYFTKIKEFYTWLLKEMK